MTCTSKRYLRRNELRTERRWVRTHLFRYLHERMSCARGAVGCGRTCFGTCTRVMVSNVRAHNK